MQSFQININEKQSIMGSLYKAANSDRIVLIVPAIGVLQSFYGGLAQFFLSNNISTITFDYSGMGESLKGNIKQVGSCLGDWGHRDLNAVLDYMLENFPHHKKILLGHSLGGQLIGLADSSKLADKIILVASQSGYWKFWKGSGQLRLWATWHLIFPIAIKVFGYMPSRKISGMENLPVNVASEWAKWCRHKNYLFGYFEEDNLSFGKIRCPITSISVDDDFFAPKDSVDWMSNKYANADIKGLHLFPKDFNVPEIGHFSLFREKFKKTIWDIFLKEIKS